MPRSSYKKVVRVRRVDPFKALHKKAWTQFSIYIRNKYADWKGDVLCFTCHYKYHWKQLQAGHYKHAVMDFNEKNIHPQCVKCNKWLHGNLDNYAFELLKKYGPGIIQELEDGKNAEKRRVDTEGHAYTLGELTAIYEKYKTLNERRR